MSITKKVETLILATGLATLAVSTIQEPVETTRGPDYSQRGALGLLGGALIVAGGIRRDERKRIFGDHYQRTF